jgi:hypothetical protein
MKNMKELFFLIITIGFIALGCNQSKEEPNYKSGVLTIDLNDTKYRNLKSVMFISKNEINQEITFERKTISHLNNYINLSDNKKFLNNHTKFDMQGNPNIFESNFFETSLTEIDNRIYIACHLGIVFNPLGRQYVIYSDFNKNFVSKSNKFDTIYFDKENDALIPVKKGKFGQNNIKFIIYDEKKQNDTVYRRTLYCTKDFFLEKK